MDGTPAPRRARRLRAPALALLPLALLGGAAVRAAGLDSPLLHSLPDLLRDPAILLPLLLVALLVRARTHDPAAALAGPSAALLTVAVGVLAVDAILDAGRPVVARWTAAPAVPAALEEPLGRLGMGGAMLLALAALWALVPRFRERMQEFGSAARLRSGVYFSVAVAVLVYGLLVWVAAAVAGPGSIRLAFPAYFPATILLVVAQTTIALGEESFYRGFLQREVGTALEDAGVRSELHRRVIAMGGVSVLFGLHHLGPGMPEGKAAEVFAYTFAVSLLFGYLFELTGNLVLPSLAHLFNNLTVLRLGPHLRAQGGIEAFGDGVYVGAYLLLSFSLLFLLAHDRSRALEPIRPGPL